MALQYIRTPRCRSELSKGMDAVVKQILRNEFPSVDKVIIPSEEDAVDKYEKEKIKQFRKLPKREVREMIFKEIQSDKQSFEFTRQGHAKTLLKIPEIARRLFEAQWIFIIPPKGTSLITSDSPCFIFSENNKEGRLFSDGSIIHFPLRPDLHLIVVPRIKSCRENYKKESRRVIKSINQLIAKNSHKCFIAKDIKYLERLIKYFKKCNHKSIRDIKNSKLGKYMKISLE